MPKQKPDHQRADRGQQRAQAARSRLAREAARLLYFGHAEGAEDAKERAARAMGISRKGAWRVFPSTPEVLCELGRVAHETEGDARFERVAQLRARALEVMMLLERFAPRLTGAVAHGVAHPGCVIAIHVEDAHPRDVLDVLSGAGCRALFQAPRDSQGGFRGKAHVPGDPPVVISIGALGDARRREPEIGLEALRAEFPAPWDEPGEDPWEAAT